ncbi:MAG TPA: flagellar hook assembly protein FlgD [Methylophilaceae bacterium]|nr:flagellar hook assembly protein FlgD [Methylophilaceae bacterium]
MTTIQNNPVSSSLLDAMNPAKAGASATEQAQDRFMTLLVTQMQNQDPLNPMDNAQMTSQLAQLSTVTGIEKLNDTMQSLIGNVQSSQTFQASSMIGRDVFVPGNVMQMSANDSKFGVELAANVDKLDVSIRDANGNIVRTMPLGAQKAGVVPLSWDGRNDAGASLPDGRYSFDVSASAGGNKIAVNPLSQGQVTSIANGSQGLTLNLKDLGSVGLSDIRQVL